MQNDLDFIWSDLERLNIKKQLWLTDSIINMFAALVKSSDFIFINTFLLSVLKRRDSERKRIDPVDLNLS